MRLSQERFAKRLTQVMDEVLDLEGKDLATRMHVKQGTISRWRNKGNKIPAEHHLRGLEMELGLPKGAFEADEEGWEAVLNTLKERDGRAYGAVTILPPGRLPSRVSEPGRDGAGWLWELPEQEAERQVRTALRRVDETVRGLVGTPTTHGLQLDLVRVFEMQCEGQRRPIPDWLRMIRNEVIEGTFK